MGILVPFIQPILAENGTLGEDSFAVYANHEFASSSAAWKAFDNDASTYWAMKSGNPASANPKNFITMYNPKPVNAREIKMSNGNAYHVTSGIVEASNDNAIWTELTTFTNSQTGSGTAWTIDLSGNTDFYNYYKITVLSGTYASSAVCNVGEIKLVGYIQQEDSRVGLTAIRYWDGAQYRLRLANTGGESSKRYEPNVSLIGDVVVNKSVLSNFNTTNYVTLPEPFSFRGSSNLAWEIGLKVKTGVAKESSDNIWSSSSSDRGVALGIVGGKFFLNLSNSDSSWSIAREVGTYEVQDNTDYWLKLIFDGTKYVFSYSLDGQSYVEDIIVNSSVGVAVYVPYLGNYGQSTGGYYFGGSIDLSECYANIDGQRWWTGMQEVPSPVNVIPVGSPYINDYTAGYFSVSDYLQLPITFSDVSNPWEVNLKIRTVVSTHNQNICSSRSTNVGLIVGIFNDNRNFSLFLGNGGSTYDTHYGTYEVLPNTTYWLKAAWDGETYTLDYSLDGENYINDIAFVSSTPIGVYVPILGMFGGATSNTPFMGYIDLAECNIISNGEEIWNGLKSETEYALNATNVGGVAISDKFIASDFSNSKYLTLPTAFQPGSNSWEMVLKVKLNNNGNNGVFLGNVSSGYLRWDFSSSNNVRLNLSTSANSWDIGQVIGTTVLENGRYYWIKATFNGSEYCIYLSENGRDYSLEGSLVTSSIPAYQSVTTLGAGNTASSNPQYTQGEIDLKECYIKINDEYWWRGIKETKGMKLLSAVKVGTPIVTDNDIALGFSTSSYLKLPRDFDVSHGEAWEMYWEVTTGSDTSASYFLGTSGRSNAYDPVVMGIYSGSGSFACYLSADGASYLGNITTGIAPEPNTLYKLRLKFTGNEYIFFVDDVLQGIVVSSTPLYKSNLIIGCQSTSGGAMGSPWLGSVDLKKSYININGQRWWSGETIYVQKMTSPIASNYTRMFVQPILTENGTIGGSSFAVAGDEYNTYTVSKAFDGLDSTFWVPIQTANPAGKYCIMYNPNPLNVKQIQVTNRASTASTVTGGIIYGSNDNSTWTELTTFTNSNKESSGVWRINLSSNENYYKYYKFYISSGDYSSSASTSVAEIKLLNTKEKMGE